MALYQILGFTFNPLITVYFSFIYPHLLYSVEVYANTKKSFLKGLMILNNKILHMLQQQPLHMHTVELYKKYNTLTTPDLHDYQLCNLVHKFLYNKEKLLALGLKILVGLLTGHIALNRHLTVVKIRADPLCTACGEEEETPYHFLGKCCASVMVRYSIFGAYLKQLEEFTRTSRRFS